MCAKAVVQVLDRVLGGPARVVLVQRDAVDDVQVHLVEVHHLRPVQVRLPRVGEGDLAPGGVGVLRHVEQRVRFLRPVAEEDPDEAVALLASGSCPRAPPPECRRSGRPGKESSCSGPRVLKRQPWKGQDSVPSSWHLPWDRLAPRWQQVLLRQTALPSLSRNSTKSRPSIRVLTGRSVTFSLHSATYQTLANSMTYFCTPADCTQGCGDEPHAPVWTGGGQGVSGLKPGRNSRG